MLSQTENILVIGDADRHIQAALAQGLPAAKVTSVASVFDGIAELSLGSFTTILAAQLIIHVQDKILFVIMAIEFHSF